VKTAGQRSGNENLLEREHILELLNEIYHWHKRIDGVRAKLGCGVRSGRAMALRIYI
jgi:hypothetical protein